MAAEAGGSVAVALGNGKVAAAVVVVVVVCSAFLGPAPALEGKLPVVVVAAVVVAGPPGELELCALFHARLYSCTAVGVANGC